MAYISVYMAYILVYLAYLSLHMACLSVCMAYIFLCGLPFCLIQITPLIWMIYNVLQFLTMLFHFTLSDVFIYSPVKEIYKLFIFAEY